MPDYKKLYFQLFSAISDALEAMDQMNFGQAKQTLLDASLQAEEEHMTD